MPMIKKHYHHVLLVLSLGTYHGHVFAAESAANFRTQADAIIQPFLENNEVPGASIALYYQGHEYILNYGYANREAQTPVTNNTIYDLASITKVFTTTILAVEVNKGVMQLNDPIVKYLPALASTKGLAIDQVKVIDLATHTASLPRDVNELGIPKNSDPMLMNALKQWQPSYPIGSQYVYSNLSFGLLGEVIANAAKKSYMDLMSQNLFQPLGMQHTLVNFPRSLQSTRANGYGPRGRPQPMFQFSYLYGGGALRSSITDMMAFMKAEVGVGPVAKDPTLLAAIKLSQQPFFKVKDNFVLGLGWQRVTRNNHLYITKNGGDVGFSTFIGVSPDNKFGVVVLINRSKVNAAGLGNQLLNLMS